MKFVAWIHTGPQFLMWKLICVKILAYNVGKVDGLNSQVFGFSSVLLASFSRESSFFLLATRPGE